MATKKDSDKLKEDISENTKATDNKKDKASSSNAARSKQAQKNTKKEDKGKKSKDSIASDKEEKTDTRSQKKESLEEKLTEAQDKYLRLSAEFDNYRKRTLKEKMDLTKSAGESILSNILPVMDDFDRALQLMDSASDCKSMKDGIDLIYNKFQEFLKSNGIKEIESLNVKFDTDLHEAITKIPAPEKKLKGKVVDVIQKGYYLNDKIIRYAKVVVGE
ncbi:MAG: nucleotide exchange factor GrpE [Bacteroidales bacterium]|nr:nucleotide exchange factor GrpE [Bacteroidales bacterium]